MLVEAIGLDHNCLVLRSDPKMGTKYDCIAQKHMGIKVCTEIRTYFSQ